MRLSEEVPLIALLRKANLRACLMHPATYAAMPVGVRRIDDSSMPADEEYYCTREEAWRKQEARQ